MVAHKADALILAGTEGGGGVRLCGAPLDAFSTVYSSFATLTGYEGPKWVRLKTQTDDDEVLSLRDEKGGTVMHWAALDDSRAGLAIALLAAGADEEAKNNGGETPLHTAAQYGCKAVARALLAAGADKGSQSKRGFTPQILAQRNGHTVMVALLSYWGAVKGAQIRK